MHMEEKVKELEAAIRMIDKTILIIANTTITIAEKSEVIDCYMFLKAVKEQQEQELAKLKFAPKDGPR